jgi:hypothetical protein
MCNKSGARFAHLSKGKIDCWFQSLTAYKDTKTIGKLNSSCPVLMLGMKPKDKRGNLFQSNGGNYLR